MTHSLAGKVALVTGGAKRIGRETALALAHAGVHVVIHYNQSSTDAKTLCGEIHQCGVNAWMVQADFSRPEEYESLISRTLEIAGSVDILINNASIFPLDTMQSVTWPSMAQNLEVNAWTPYVLGRAFKELVGKGAIVNMLDSRLHGYDWNHVAYIVSKHALALLTRMTALEYAPYITVNGVAPGLILPPPGKDVSYIERMKDTVPLKRHGDADDIADAVLFLASSRFITGEVIYIDGGRHLLEYAGGPNPH